MAVFSVLGEFLGGFYLQGKNRGRGLGEFLGEDSASKICSNMLHFSIFCFFYIHIPPYSAYFVQFN